MALQTSYIHRITPELIEKCKHNPNALILVVDRNYPLPAKPTHYIRYSDYPSMRELKSFGWREVTITGEQA